MRQEATVRLNLSQLMNANDRRHWRQELRMKADLVAFGRLALGRGMKPMRDQIRVTFEFRFPDRRRRDRLNWAPTCKHLLDGIVQQGVLTDDSDLFVDGPYIVIRDELSGQPGFVLVKVILLDARRARLADAEAVIMREREIADREKARKQAEKAEARRAKAAESRTSGGQFGPRVCQTSDTSARL